MMQPRTRLSDVDRRHSDIARYVGPDNILSLGDNKGLLAQRNGDGSVRVYVARRASEHWLRDNGLMLRSWSTWCDDQMIAFYRGRSTRFPQINIGKLS